MNPLNRVLAWINCLPRREAPELKTVARVISFPKSGRTWLRLLIDELEVALDYSHAKSGYWASRHWKELPDPKGHPHFKTIVLVRDPRDTLVSGYFQATKRIKKYDGPISHFCRDPHRGIEKIAVFNLRWTTLTCQRSDMISLTYEAMHVDIIHELLTILEFLDQPRPSRDYLETVVRNHTFETMRKKEALGLFEEAYGRKLKPTDNDDPESYKVRRGVVGGYTDYLSEDDIAYCDQVLDEYRYWEIMNTNLGGLPHAAETIGNLRVTRPCRVS